MVKDYIRIGFYLFLSRIGWVLLISDRKGWFLK